ncbi:hypothetical protein L1049_020167 [Liquidambar formosana]|uniref:Late embryogenesis abundant protein LEA-2 subgroup domain-containing protein n=1 Tax=Liquidambar formosana TaxID=63359 RepID=A0AAP0SCQ1_LIQFO
MAENNREQFYPLAPANGQARGDPESPTVQPKELRRKKRIKCAAYIAAFAVFQTIIIVAFSLTVMRIKNPKFRVRSLTIETPTAGNVNSSSTSMRFHAEVIVKNTNFGHYKFENSTITFSYLGNPVGKADVLKGRSKARSTKKMNVTVDVTYSVPKDSRILVLKSQSKLSGKVHLMKVIKKKKSTEMDCTVNVNLETYKVDDIKCK